MSILTSKVQKMALRIKAGPLECERKVYSTVMEAVFCPLLLQ